MVLPMTIVASHRETVSAGSLQRVLFPLLFSGSYSVLFTISPASDCRVNVSLRLKPCRLRAISIRHHTGDDHDPTIARNGRCPYEAGGRGCVCACIPPIVVNVFSCYDLQDSEMLFCKHKTLAKGV